MQLLKGQKVDLTKGRNTTNLSLQFGWTAEDKSIGIDVAAFLLSEQNRCERDENFIFYGNPASSNGSVSHSALTQGGNEAVSVTLAAVPAEIARIALTLTIYEGEVLGHSFHAVSHAYLRLLDRDTGTELFRFDYGSDLGQETAVVVGELYRYGSEWKFHAIGSGFNGGLAALCTNYGLEVEKSGTAEVAATVEAPERSTEALQEQPTGNILSSIDLRKKLVGFTLEKKQLIGVTARVGIVLDITGSMRNLYNNGTVQEIVERILAVACEFDDNGSLDVWVYDTEFSRLPPVTERELGRYVFTHIINNKHIHKFGRNNEPPVMEDIIKKYTEEEDDTTPVLIIFINDGGVVKPTQKVIRAASVLPIFWQFVGIGDSDFEVLKGLDTMQGRLVDNASFIHLDRIDTVSDEELYDQLLNEFPLWLKAAKAKRILRD
ncbi:stress protein [Paenibacillus donghaensis]|uniref:Stress protein n=1 Tax=Paenibacillus donghaensis TaxID=414771 RepID=A0A2Z2KFX8_9BACL|nr:VWA domain-containing protein [Paenibacillus donghaensis]ASA19712.1 stress protein [Paenibacillus donghaensis]